jgi:hypothetical protein
MQETLPPSSSGSSVLTSAHSMPITTSSATATPNLGLSSNVVVTPNLGLVVGVAVASVVALVAIVALLLTVLYCRRRRAREVAVAGTHMSNYAPISGAWLAEAATAASGT